MSDYGTPPPGDPNDPSRSGYGQQPGGYGQQPGYGQPAGSPPNNYLVPAILVTLFCCLPLGIPSIVFASQVNSKHAAGDVSGAQESSEKAKKFAIWGAVIGGIVNTIVVVLYLMAIASVAGSA